MKFKKLYRAIGASDLKVDVENRTIEFPFSSERAVDRWFGKEILSHEKSAIDLERAELGAMPLLFNHDMAELRGKVERVWLGGDRRLWCAARFAKTEKASEAMELARDGMLPNVSFGYMIEDLVLSKINEENEWDNEYTATKWAPFEVSLVTVPADPTVGLGRGAEQEDKHFYDRMIKPLLEKGNAMPKENITETIEQRQPAVETGKVRTDAIAEERKRISDITALGEKFGKQDLARKLVADGTEINEAKDTFLREISVRQESLNGAGGSSADLGLSKKEKQQYSWLRVIQALANPTNRKLQEAASYEREVSEAGAKLRGKESQGFFVPYEILAHRDLSKGTPSAGGYLVGTEHRPQDFIEMLRNASILQQAGVRVLNGLHGDITIPKQSGGATAYWVGEASAPTESQQTFGQVALAPKTVGAFTDMSRKLMIQSSPDIEQLVKNDLATVLALAIDLAGLYGSGNSNQPLGVVNTSGIKTKDFASAMPTYGELVDMESSIAAANALVANMKYLTDPTVRGALKKAVKFSSTDAQVWEAGNKLNGYDALVSTQITAEDVIFGNWADLIMGFWSGLDLTVDQAALATAGGSRIIVLQDVDLAVRHAESFCLGNDAQ